MKKKIIIGMCLMLVIVGILSGCLGTSSTSSILLDGNVKVVFESISRVTATDLFYITFYETGDYSVNIKYQKNHDSNTYYHSESFMIDELPPKTEAIKMPHLNGEVDVRFLIKIGSIEDYHIFEGKAWILN